MSSFFALIRLGRRFKEEADLLSFRALLFDALRFDALRFDALRFLALRLLELRFNDLLDFELSLLPLRFFFAELLLLSE